MAKLLRNASDSACEPASSGSRRGLSGSIVMVVMLVVVIVHDRDVM